VSVVRCSDLTTDAEDRRKPYSRPGSSTSLGKSSLVLLRSRPDTVRMLADARSQAGCIASDCGLPGFRSPLYYISNGAYREGFHTANGRDKLGSNARSAGPERHINSSARRIAPPGRSSTSWPPRPPLPARPRLSLRFPPGSAQTPRWRSRPFPSPAGPP
jgi:hypothetical protein